MALEFGMELFFEPGSTWKAVCSVFGSGLHCWQILIFSKVLIYCTLPFRCTQVKKKGPLQTPKPLIFFLFPISENVDVEILQRGNFEKKLFLRFVMGLFSPGPEVFSRYLWNGRSTLKIEENKMHFFFDFGSRWVLPKFSGAPWDPLGPFLDPLGPP